MPTQGAEEHEWQTRRRRTDGRLGGVFRLADTIDRRLTAGTQPADKLTQPVLAKAFPGEPVPTEAELARRKGRSYEPASALLERIRAERHATVDKPTAKRRRVSSRQTAARKAR
jgi:hypothetical protein